jgi:hypothetical protein
MDREATAAFVAERTPERFAACIFESLAAR